MALRRFEGALNRADADTDFLCDLADRQAVSAPIMDGGNDSRRYLRATADPSFLPGPSQTCPDALLNHSAFELGEHAAHLEHGFAGGRGGVDPLLMQVEVNTLRVDFAKEGDKVLLRPTEAIH